MLDKLTPIQWFKDKIKLSLFQKCSPSIYMTRVVAI
jgi:hypothetical protein